MLQLIDIKKAYKTATLEQQVLKGVSLSLRDNEFVAILGQSGSGKTTLLNIIGGLDRYDEGELIINGISTKKYGSRDWDSYRNHTVGFVFQSYNLIPHQTLLSNVELALTISGISKAERTKRAEEALEKVGLAEHMHNKPNQISGGQMQRVAIARALVNDPDILLADEPTGALDSDTSIQVMDLLKEVARDRLVVMVTHNPELAEEYATRIVRLRDGRIEDDTDPFEPEAAGEQAVHRNMGHSSMSFLTALALSFNNLWTKKARTILVALAGSIGIIGIALIMSLSNGVNQYVADIESEALQNYPLMITDTTFGSAMLFAMANSTEEEPEPEQDGSGPKGGDVQEIPMLTSIFSQMVTNDLASLRTYFESGDSGIYDNVQTIEYDYNIVPQIFAQLDSGVRQVNPDQSFAALGFSSGSGNNALWNTFSSSDTFVPLPKKTELYEDNYDVKAGRWPKDHTECVVVLSHSGRIADMCLYAIGLKDPKDLDSMVQSFADGTEIEIRESDAVYNYDDFLGRKFKVVKAADLYSYDDGLEVWVNHSNDAKYIEDLMDSAEDLVIVGVVQPSEDNTTPIINMGVGYPADLISHLIDEAAESEIVKAQLADPETNVLTGLAFGEDKNDGDMDLGSLFSIDENALANAFSFNTDGLDLSDYDFSDLDFSDMDFSDLDLSDLDFSGLDLSGMDFSDFDLSGMDFPEFDPESIDYNDFIPELTEDDLRKLLSGVRFDMPETRVRRLLNRIWDGYMRYAGRSDSTDYSNLSVALTRYLVTPEARDAMLKELKAIWEENSKNFITSEEILAIFSTILEGYDAYTGVVPEDETERDYSRMEEYLQTEEARQIVEESRNFLQDKFEDSLVTDKQVRDLMLNMLSAYDDYARGHALPVLSLFLESFGDYLQSDKGIKDLQYVANAFLDSANLEEAVKSMFEGMENPFDFDMDLSEQFTDQFAEQFSEQLEEQMKPVMEQLMGQVMERIGEAVSENLEDAMGKLVDGLRDAMANAFSFDPRAFENAFQSAMDMDELSNLMMSMYYTEESSSEANLHKFGYADYERPSTITIYPLDFEAKKRVKTIIDDYNTMQKDAGEDDKVIVYTDAVDMLMGSVTDIIKVVRDVLIAFVSISLVVSSVMIGVITYISVLERQKEIGILRAIGASKGNISQVFNAETFITGALAGLLGVGITLAAIPPINAIIHNLTGQYNINAVLPLTSAGVLVLLSIVLTLLGGIIPSMKAAKSDPVSALRSE